MIITIAMWNSCCRSLHQPQDLRLRRDVERRRRLVGDQDVRVVDQRHRDHHALAHAAGELVRVVVDALLGTRDADLPEELDRPVRGRPCFVTSSWTSDRLLELPADALDRVQRRHRVLEDHRHPRAADLAQLRELDACRISLPSSSTEPVDAAAFLWLRPITDRQVTLLPEPDSPTMPSVSPFSTEKLTPSTAWTIAVVRPERRPEVRDLEERPSGEPDPRVEEGVQEVDDQVEDDDRDRREDDDPDDHRQVVLVVRL